jgi:ComF family protein
MEPSSDAGTPPIWSARLAGLGPAALRQGHAIMRRTLQEIYPPTCVLCDARVAEDHALCPDCWRDAPFLSGLVCDCCGVPLPGQDDGAVRCDDCLTIARPWDRGRAALAYAGTGRAAVLALKHADRGDLALPAARWMLRAAQPILRPGMLVVPVPVHRWRLVTRRYNQAALLAHALGRAAGLDVLPDALQRTRTTGTQDGKGREARFANMERSIRPHPQRGAALAGRDVLLVDDVMTSGATFAACADAARAAGAASVSVLALARVTKDP